MLTFGLWSSGAVAQSDLDAQMLAALPQGSAELSASSAAVVDYKLLVSAAEKVGRELRFDKALTVSGERTLTLWKLPPGAQLDDVYELASMQLSGTQLFECLGRDCGRSTAWANLIFSEALVVGQNRFQRYRVVRSQQGLLQSLYVIMRGNRRVHLLLETVQPTEVDGARVDGTGAVVASSVRQALTRSGMARMSAVPRADGAFDDASLEALEQTGKQLEGLKVGEIYVVCHLYGAASAAELIEQSDRCAENAKSSLVRGYEAARQSSGETQQSNRARPASTTFNTFGAGPLMPLGMRPQSDGSAAVQGNRVELIVPAQLR